MLKRLAAILLCAALVLSLQACSVPGTDDSRSDEEQVMEYLEDKYKEEFVIDKNYGSVIFSGGDQFLVHPAANPDILFEAEAARDGFDPYEEYVAACVSRQIENRISENLSPMLGEVYVKALAASKGVDSSDTNMTPQEFVAYKPSNKFSIYLHCVPIYMSKQDIMDSLTEMFDGIECLSGTVYLTLVDKQTLEDVKAYFKSNAKPDYGYEQIVDGSFIAQIPFENGNIS